MSMFDTTDGPAADVGRKENTVRKLERMNRALRHQEPDRVPISDFFWGSFIQRWRQDLGLPADANPYYYYDLDWIVTVPNMDPWIRPFATLSETPEEVVVKTGFGAIMHKHFEFRCRRCVPGRPTRSRSWSGHSSMTHGIGGASSPRGTTRSPAWATASNAIRLPGLRQ